MSCSVQSNMMMNDLDLIDDMREIYNYFTNMPFEFMHTSDLAYWKTRVLGMHGLLTKLEKVLIGPERETEMRREIEKAGIVARLEMEGIQ